MQCIRSVYLNSDWDAPLKPDLTAGRKKSLAKYICSSQLLLWQIMSCAPKKCRFWIILLEADWEGPWGPGPSFSWKNLVGYIRNHQTMTEAGPSWAVSGSPFTKISGFVSGPIHSSCITAILLTPWWVVLTDIAISLLQLSKIGRKLVAEWSNNSPTESPPFQHWGCGVETRLRSFKTYQGFAFSTQLLIVLSELSDFPNYYACHQMPLWTLYTISWAII